MWLSGLRYSRHTADAYLNRSSMITLAITDDEIRSCFDTLKQLRPKIEENNFVATVRNMMKEGFQLACVKDDAGLVRCVAGFKIAHNFHLGKHLYVEDLITAENARSKGIGTKMFDWLTAYAKAEHCAAIHLNSGVQRHAAHKFYLNQDMKIVSYHFSAEIP